MEVPWNLTPGVSPQRRSQRHLSCGHSWFPSSSRAALRHTSGARKTSSMLAAAAAIRARHVVAVPAPPRPVTTHLVVPLAITTKQ